MDNSSGPQEADAQKSSGFLTVLQIFDSIERWLAGLFELAKEEEEVAGVYFHDER